LQSSGQATGAGIYESLNNFGFRFHHISFGKPHAEVIIDDRAMKFTNWKRAKTEIKKLLKDEQGESNG